MCVHVRARVCVCAHMHGVGVRMYVYMCTLLLQVMGIRRAEPFGSTCVYADVKRSERTEGLMRRYIEP